MSHRDIHTLHHLVEGFCMTFISTTHITVNFTQHFSKYNSTYIQTIHNNATKYNNLEFNKILFIYSATQKSWLKITAPPAGYRKWHVLYFDELFLASLQYTAQKSSLKSLDHGQNCDNSSSRVNIEVWRRIIPRQRTRCCHNSSVQCPITAKLLCPDQRPSLNSSMCQYFLSVIAPPTDSTLKQEVLCKSTLYYPTCSKLQTHDHNPDLNTSIY